jgi:hypothetical protein
MNYYQIGKESRVESATVNMGAKSHLDLLDLSGKREGAYGTKVGSLGSLDSV